MRYEIKKIFWSRYILLCLIILMGFFVVFIINAYKARVNYSKEYERLLTDISQNGYADEKGLKEVANKRDEILQHVFEDGKAASNIKGEFGKTVADDMLLYSKAYDEIKYIYIDFPEGRKRIVTDALSNIKNSNSEKIISENEIVIEKYNRRIDMPLKNSGNLFDTLYFFDNTVWDYALIVFVIMLTVRAFSIDISSGAYQVVYSTAVKRKKLFFKAFISVLLFTVIILLITSICQIICGYFFFGVNDLSLPLQMTSYFELCPYLFSVLDYYIIKLLCKLLFYIALISISALFTVFSRRQASAMPFSMVVFITPLIIITYYFTLSTADSANSSDKSFLLYKELQTFIPQGLLNIKTYFNSFDYVNIAGVFMPRILCCVIITAVLAIGAFIMALQIYARPKR